MTPNVIDIFARLESPEIQGKLFAHLQQKHSYQELTRDVRKLSSFFAELSLHEGQRVLISSRDSYAVGLLFWACLRNGLTAVMLDPDMGPNRAHELIGVCDIQHLFLDRATVDNWHYSDEQAQVTVIGERKRKRGALLNKLLKRPKTPTISGPSNLWQLLDKLTPTSELTSLVTAETIAYILFTSGSTATPKAVQISQGSLWQNLADYSTVYEMGENAKIFNILTVYHTDGVIQGPVLSGFNAASWYHPMEFSITDIPAIFDAIYTHQITHFMTVPTMLHLLHQFKEGFEDTFDNDTFKHIICSSAPLELPLWEAFEKDFGLELVNVYGLTETIVGASISTSVNQSRKIGSAGKALGCEFKIVDDKMQELGDEQEGELLIRGANVFTAYLNNPTANAEAFHEGWFRSGDLARRDKDGFYYISGRKKNLVISGGINIQPEEVMAVLNAHPAISESACVGLVDELFGELLVAAIVLREGEIGDENTLSDYCRQELEEAKIPKQYHFVDELPKTVSGKVKYNELRQTLLITHEAPLTTRNDNSLKVSILKIAAKSFKCSESAIDFKTASTATVDGWDSLAHLTFVTSLESAFDIHLSTKEIMNVASLVDAERMLAQKTKA